MIWKKVLCRTSQNIVRERAVTRVAAFFAPKNEKRFSGTIPKKLKLALIAKERRML